MTRDDGGPANPVDDLDDHPGMSLRDAFAIAALQGCLAYSHMNESWGDYHNNGSDYDLAQRCFRLADAMLLARAKP